MRASGKDNPRCVTNKRLDHGQVEPVAIHLGKMRIARVSSRLSHMADRYRTIGSGLLPRCLGGTSCSVGSRAFPVLYSTVRMAPDRIFEVKGRRALEGLECDQGLGSIRNAYLDRVDFTILLTISSP